VVRLRIDTAKAERWPNPWYGIIPSQWLDVWCGKEAGEAKLLDQVAKRLRQLSDVAVRGCEAVWKAAATVWGELAKSTLDREREVAAEKRRLARKKAREAEEARRKKAQKQLQKSFLWGLRVRKAKAGARRQWNAVIRRGGARTADECSLRYWEHWSDERVTSWWTSECARLKRAAEAAESQKRRDQRSGPGAGQRSVTMLWSKGWSGEAGRGAGARRRGVGDGADEPG
jgi:hypothetical protein